MAWSEKRPGHSSQNSHRPSAFPYSSAGCGLGSQIFQTEAPLFASTSNSISFNQSFAISFGTSGCNEDGRLKKENRLVAFFAFNQNALMKDSAKGEGETLDALKQLFGCTGNQTVENAIPFAGQSDQHFQLQLKRNFGLFFPKQMIDPYHQAHQLCALIAQDQILRSTCSLEARNSLCIPGARL